MHPLYPLMGFSEANEAPGHAYKLLFKAAMVIPAWHYVAAVVVVCLVFLYRFLEFHFLEDLFSGFKGSPVLLTYNSCSEIYQEVVSKCQTLHGRYLATPWLSNPHFQTIFVNFFGRAPLFNYKRQLFHASDGGTFALDWLMSAGVFQDTSRQDCTMSKHDTAPIVVVIPGLMSDSASPYIRHLAFATEKQGWNVVICNHRGMGGISVTSDCFYNAGWTEDIREVVEHLHQKYPNSPVFVVGTSIGANILVKYLGEEGENTAVAGAATICSPWDLLVASRFICRKLIQKLYDRALTIGLQGYAQLHQPRYSHIADWEGIKKSRSIRDFDTYATCLVGNYETVDTYYRHCSSSSFVQSVSVPLLCIGSLDDPVCTSEAIPWDECRVNKNIVLAMTKHGGHLGFFEGLAGSSLWWVGAVNEFFGVLHTSPIMHRKKAQSPVHRSAAIESSIDQGPYVSVADGMVSTMGTEPRDDDAIKESLGQKDCGRMSRMASENQCELVQEDSSEQGPSITHTSKEDPGSNIVVSRNASIVTRCLNQLSKRNKRSMWLLAYVAILSTFPLLGTALGFLFRNKAKKVLPAKTHK